MLLLLLLALVSCEVATCDLKIDPKGDLKIDPKSDLKIDPKSNLKIDPKGDLKIDSVLKVVTSNKTIAVTKMMEIIRNWFIHDYSKFLMIDKCVTCAKVIEKTLNEIEILMLDNECKMDIREFVHDINDIYGWPPKFDNIKNVLEMVDDFMPVGYCKRDVHQLARITKQNIPCQLCSYTVFIQIGWGLLIVLTGFAILIIVGLARCCDRRRRREKCDDNREVELREIIV